MGKELLNASRLDDAHTGQRLTDELVIWFGSTRPDGRPHQVPVWFWWQDPEVVIFSMPDTQKLRNIQRASAVALHLDTAAGGGDVVIAEGTAAIVDEDAVAHLTDGFAAKYSPVLGAPGIPAWRAMFSQPILVAVTRVVAWTRSGGQLADRSVP